MDSSDKKAANVNIDINGGDADDGGVKNMDLDAQNDGKVGLSKDELMKYANQPFWIRLRNILFASFWIIWLSILVIAIAIVVNSPGCVKQASASVATGGSAASPSSS